MGNAAAWAGLLMLLAPAQSKENLEYQYWAGCKAGSWVRNRMEMTNGDQKVQYETTTRLIEVTPERVVVETYRRLKAPDRTIDSPPQKQEIRASDPDRGKIVSEKDEEITVSGHTLRCRCYEVETSAEGNKPKMTVKAWMAKEIPGGVVKSEVTSEQLKGPIRTTVLEWEKQ